MRPDILVLGGGGVLGEAWMMGVLAGIEDASGVDLRQCEYFIGTSAGSIVSANLVAGRSPRRPPSATKASRPGPSDPAGPVAEGLSSAAWRAGEWALAVASTFAPLALGVAAPGGALMRAALLSRLPRPPGTLDPLRQHIDGMGARFDGRLRVATVDRDSGRRVVFGSPGAPQATVAEAVAASCSVPWLFAPVRIGDRDYVDGGVWSPTNGDAAPAGAGSHVLCLNPTASLAGAGDAIGVFRRISQTAAAIETLALKRRGAQVESVHPDAGSAEAMGVNLMDRRPSRRVLEAGYGQGLALGSG
ncbi:MAG: patatin-like phospholipase family protein [Solirubrobacteraceae bacterium]